MDVRELLDDPEEAFRIAFAGLQKAIWTNMPARIIADTKDGHTATVQPTIKREVVDPETGQTSFEDHPLHVDVPIHHLGGGGVSSTYPTKAEDEGALHYASRAVDSWFQSGGSQQPMDGRVHSLADAFFLSGIRSLPRKLEQVEKDAAQVRSDDKLHTITHHPQNGTHVKSCDASTPPASPSFDPYAAATKFFEHFVHPQNGVIGNATDGSNTHTHGVTHDDGAFMRALNGLHAVLAHPQNGALLSAAGGQHLVQAHPTAGLKLQSTEAIALDSPSLSLPKGSIGADALDPNAIAGGIGNLGGDLSGTLPSPQVVGITHVTGADKLPNAANDSAAAGLGVKVGSLYRNGSQLMVRVA